MCSTGGLKGRVHVGCLLHVDDLPTTLPSIEVPRRIEDLGDPISG